jgi:murein DD-endopeptidase MepM/ murein hydrolase activator NlpD
VVTQPPVGGDQSSLPGGEALNPAGSTLIGARQVQSSVDGLKKTVDELNKALKTVIPALKATSHAVSSQGIGAPGQYPSSPLWNILSPRRTTPSGQTANGGGATFNGQPAGGQQGGGRGGGGGRPAPQPPGNAGRGATGVATALAYGAAQGAKGAALGQMGNLMTADAVMTQLALGGVDRRTTQNSFKGDITARDMADSAGAHFALARQLNVQPGNDSRFQSAIGAAGLINPARTDTETAAVAVGINQPFTSMKLKGLGIDMGTGVGSSQDPLTLARQILGKIPGQMSIDTPAKITEQLDSPNGAINLTLINWEAHGYLPPGSVPVIKDEIRSILLARLKGMDFKKLQTLTAQARSDDKGKRGEAINQLTDAGVVDTSAAAKMKAYQSGKRDIATGLTEDYATGVAAATKALGAFTSALEGITGAVGQRSGQGSSLLQSIPIVGTYIGWLSGGGGGSGSDIGAMSNDATGGPAAEKLGNSAAGTPLTTSTASMGSATSSGAAGSQSGAGKTSGVGKRTVKFIKPVSGRITSGFGTRKDPITGRSRSHTGLDFGVGSGTPIHAAAAGKVTFSGSRGANYWAGNHVIIDHGGGVETLYAHQSRTKARVGSTVQQGEVIGYVGSTGRATGPHLHFEIHINGRPVNPAPYLAGAGVSVSGVGAGSTTSPSASTDTGVASSNGTASGRTGAQPGGVLSGWSNPSVEEVNALGSFAGATGPGGSSTAVGQDTSASTSSSSSTTSQPQTSSSVPSAPSSSSGNKAIVQQMAAARGWTGKQWDALYQLVMHESGFKNIAQNPTSSAMGLFQFLNGTWKGYGPKTTDPRLQTKYGLQYIADRYGNPINAWSKWQGRSPHWYDKGAWELQGDQPLVGHKGEMIIPALPAKQIREILLNGTAFGANKAGLNSGLTINIEKGAIVVQTATGGVTSAGVADLGKAVADALAENDKIKRIQAGVLT